MIFEDELFIFVLYNILSINELKHVNSTNATSLYGTPSSF